MIVEVVAVIVQSDFQLVLKKWPILDPWMTDAKKMTLSIEFDDPFVYEEKEEEGLDDNYRYVYEL